MNSKTILITGASSGFGYKMTEDFLKAGHRVIATMRNSEERTHIFKNFFDQLLYQEQLTVLTLDVTAEKDRKNVKNYITDNLDGKLDVLINNAGYGVYGALEDVDEQQIRTQFEVNFFGAVFLTKELLPYLRATQGKIINLSSIMGQFSMPLGSIYSASKFALEGLCEGLYYELASQNVQICSVLPGGHRTGFLKSLTWGQESHNENSYYQTQTNGMLKMMDKMQRRVNAPDAKNVSDEVLKLVMSKKMPRRKIVGKDAVFANIMKKILPGRIYHKLLNYQFSKLLRA